jgi:glycosyltransferase involved in cell wall biosynthesis
VFVENMPSRTPWRGFVHDPPNPEVFVIGFIGVLRYRKCLEQLIDAVRLLRKEGVNIRVKFAGGGEVEEVRSYARGEPEFVFLGPFRYSQDVQRLYADLDVIYSVYDGADRNCQLAMPNKFYESIITGIPIMVADKTYLERRVRDIGAGTGVAYEDVEALAEMLRDAVARRGWYARASTCLKGLVVEQYFREHEAAIERAVLG